MIGAVIGDLAAWTWKHDKKCFYERLVSPEARLSGYGLLPITLWQMIHEGGAIIKHRLYTTGGKALVHSRCAGIDIPDNWYTWGLIEFDKPMPFELKITLILSCIIDSGYLPEHRQNELKWHTLFHGGKQEHYAMRMMTILRRLNEGLTKDDAIADIPACVFNYYPSGTPHKWHDLLEYITFAWRCFYYSWDFTSALHNATKCTGNLHLAMMLTGAFADAMYGSRYSMTMVKFGGEYMYIDFPKTLPDHLLDQVRKIRNIEFDNRHIFKKNEALTNVERHSWTYVENPYSERLIDRESKKKMMRAYDTGWDCRYGVYLENGWFYVYRSHHLLLRYKLEASNDSDSRIVYLQISNDDHARVEDLGEVLYTLNSLS